MEVKNGAPRIAPTPSVTRAPPVALAPETVVPVAADAFAGVQASAPVVAQAPLEGASETALWGAAEVAAAEAVGELAKPSFAGAKVEKDRWGQPALTFTVAKGDTLARLGRAAGMDYLSLAHYNLIDNPNAISVGQKVAIPTTFHEVKKGETYWGISHKLGIDHRLLMKLNRASPDAMLRVGQEIRVPASLVTQAQVDTRAKLVRLLDDSAAAESRMYFGPGSFRPRHMGNDLGYTGVADTDARFQFSDDFSVVKTTRGESGQPPTVTRLANPERDLRKLLVSDTVRALATLRAEQLRLKFPEFPGAFNVVGPKQNQDGTVDFVITGPADGEDYLSYDPRAGTVTISDNSDRRTVLPAAKPTEVVDALQRHYRLQLPAYA